MTGARFLAGLRRLVMPVLAGCMVVSLGFSAGPVIARLIEDPAAPPPRSAAKPQAGPAGPDLGGVLAAAPFGAAQTEAAALSVVAGDTPLGLRLLGVALSETPDRSRAILEGPDGKAQSHAVGAGVLPGVTLVGIAADHVELKVQDRVEALYFPNAAPPLPSAAAGVAAPANPAPSGLDALRAMAPRVARYGVPAVVAPTDPDAVIARYRAAIRHNAASVMLRLGIEATDEGYLIKDVTAPVVRLAGFRPGDLVTLVNGEAVGNVGSDIDLFDRIAESGLARVDVLRAGRPVVLSFPLR